MKDNGRPAEALERCSPELALLDNMPAMVFSKDGETGRYLACNQLFVEYTHKATPEEVVGLTDGDIFDPEAAAHFTEDDRKALAMDEPYTFIEDVPDPLGNPRQKGAIKKVPKEKAPES